MIIVSEVYNILQEESEIENFFSEDEYGGREALTHETHDMLIAIVPQIGDDEVFLKLCDYLSGDEITLKIVGSEDDLPDLNAQIASSILWWMETTENLQIAQYIENKMKPLIREELVIDDYEPDLIS